MSGIKSSTFNGTMKPHGVPHPSQPAKKVNAIVTSSAPVARSSSFSGLLYSRRYLDWNRLTFAYHAVASQSKSFDYRNGLRISSEITTLRKQLNLTALYGCAPQTWCLNCKPPGNPGNINTLLETALAATVINSSRTDIPRLILINTGSVRFDLVEGPFTYDDSFIVSPFTDTFQFIPNVPYAQAKQVLGILNAGPFQKRNTQAESRDLETRDFGFTQMTGDQCGDAAASAHEHALRSRAEPLTRGPLRRQTTATTPGYTTKVMLLTALLDALAHVTIDDFGSDGDDTIHSAIPFYSQPNDLQANASFPTDGSMPDTVDLIFLDFIGITNVVPALNQAGGNYTAADIQQYLPPAFDTNAYLPAYAKMAWQANVPNCPVGKGVGYTK